MDEYRGVIPLKPSERKKFGDDWKNFDFGENFYFTKYGVWAKGLESPEYRKALQQGRELSRAYRRSGDKESAKEVMEALKSLEALSKESTGIFNKKAAITWSVLIIAIFTSVFLYSNKIEISLATSLFIALISGTIYYIKKKKI